MTQEDKHITINLCDGEGLCEMNRKELMDKLSEKLIEYYEEGKYSYEECRANDIPVPEKNRQIKSRMRNQLMDMTKGTSMAPKTMLSFIQYLYDIDERLVQSLKKQRRELKERLKIITDKHNELKQNTDKIIEKKVNDLAQTRVDELYGELKEDLAKSRETNVMRFNIINRLQDDIDFMTKNKSSELKTSQETILALELEIKELKDKINKKSVGRPKLTKKQKKENRKKKIKEEYKKKMEKINNESESSSESDNESEGSASSDSD